LVRVAVRRGVAELKGVAPPAKLIAMFLARTVAFLNAIARVADIAAVFVTALMVEGERVALMLTSSVNGVPFTPS